MTPNTWAFLAGILAGNIFLPALLCRLRPGGRWDGWIDGRRSTPAKGQFVLVCEPSSQTIHGYTFAGKEGATAGAEIYWRPPPRPPLLFRSPP
jgi:hypothetical protein